MQRREFQAWGPVALAALLACATLLAVWFVGRPPGTPLGFPLDDAWIHLVYGRSLANEGALAYNPGEPTTGATSVLWAVLLGGVHLVWGEAPLAVRIAAVLLLGGAFHVLTAALCADLARRMANSRAGLAAGVLVAANPALAAAALSGMEVALTTALLVAGVHALHRRAWLAAGVWLGLAPLARPEAALAAVLLVAWSAVLDRPGQPRAWLKRALQLGGPAVVLGVWLVARNLATTQHPLPATYYAKLVQVPWSETPARTWHALRGVLGQTPPLWHGLTLLLLPGLAARNQARALLPLLASFGFVLAHVRVLDPGDPRVFYTLRYLLPIVPTLTVALVLAAVALGARWLPRVAGLPLALLALAALAQAGLTLRPVSAKLANDTANIDALQCAAGRWIHDNVPADRRVASVDAGAVRYLGERWTLDMLGLNTPMVLWDPAPYLRAHPVAAVVFMPELGKPQASAEFTAPWSHRVADYTVTQFAPLAFQAIVTCQKAADPGPRPMRFDGPRCRTLLWCERF